MVEEKKETLQEIPEPKAEDAPKEGEKETPVEEKKEEPKVEEPKVEEPKAEESKVEEPKAKESLEEPKEEEKPKEEPKEEALKEEPKEEKKEEEALSKDIKKTKEELGVIQEVRDELVALYAQNQDISTAKEQLSETNTKLTKDIKDMKEQLTRYQDAEKKLQLKQRAERLEKLSKKFSVLGQDKTVEQLSKKDDETLSEFEKVVDAALEKSGDMSALPEVTNPSQASVETENKEALSEEEKSKEKPPVKAGKASEALKETNDGFFERMCKTMSSEQLSGNRRARYV